MIDTNFNLDPQQSANRASVFETLLRAKGLEVSSAALAHVNPQYVDEVEELQAMDAPITVHPTLCEERVSVCFRLDVNQEGRRVMRKLFYSQNLERAMVSAAQTKLCLARALLAAPQHAHRMLDPLREGQQAALELLAVAKEGR